MSQKNLLEKRRSIMFFPEKRSVLLKAKTWNLWLNKAKTKDGRTVFPLKVNEVEYDSETHKFTYKKLRDEPIWLSEKDLGDLRDAFELLLRKD